MLASSILSPIYTSCPTAVLLLFLVCCPFTVSISSCLKSQVYRGTTVDGCAVAVKVQRPNLHHVVARDIYILRLGVRTKLYSCLLPLLMNESKIHNFRSFQLELLQKISKRKNDIRLYADELGKGLMGELDYRLEAANASRFLVPLLCSSKLKFFGIWKEYLSIYNIVNMPFLCILS